MNDERKVPVIISSNSSSSSSSSNVNSIRNNNENNEKKIKALKYISDKEKNSKVAYSSNTPHPGPQHTHGRVQVQGGAAPRQQQARQTVEVGSNGFGVLQETRHHLGQNLPFVKHLVSVAPRQSPSRTQEGRSSGRLYARRLYLRQVERKNRLQRPFQSRWPSAYLPSRPWAARVRGYIRDRPRMPLLPLTHKKTSVRAFWNLSRNNQQKATERRSASSKVQDAVPVPEAGRLSLPTENNSFTNMPGATRYGAAGGLHQLGSSGQQHPDPSQHSGNHRLGPREGYVRLAPTDHAQKLSGELRDPLVVSVGGTPTLPQQLGHRRKSVNSSAAPKRTVPILGLFDLTVRGKPRLGGRSELAAAQMALRHINEQQVIPGHTLVMFHNDTQVRIAILNTHKHTHTHTHSCQESETVVNVSV